MADATYDIDAIVQQVLAGLRGGIAGQAGIGTKKNSLPGEIVVSASVVTLSQVEGRLDGVQQLTAPRGAVVTPAVRDLLQEKNIALAFSTGNSGPGVEKRSTKGGDKTARLALVAAVLRENTSIDRNALGRALQKDGIEVEPSQSNCLVETSGRIAERLKDDGFLGAIVTSHPAAAVCLANRLPGVRAIAPARPESVLPECKDVGANVLVIDPAGRGFFQVKQMIREFCLSGRHECPKSLRAQLG